MEISTYVRFSTSSIIDFIALCYRHIGREVDLIHKDYDLNDIKSIYCSSGGDFFVLHERETIIGTIAVKFFQAPKGRVGEVHRFYVHPDEQKKGYGTKLLQYIYNYAMHQRAVYLRGTTEYRLEDAVSLLRKYGAYEIPQYRKSAAEAFFEKEIPENLQNPDFSEFVEQLKESFAQLETQNKKTLILNPVENYPKESILYTCSSSIHGLYNTDSLRSNEEKILSKIQFSGRDIVTSDVNAIYKQWAKILGAEALTMRLLSGLHAHIVLFMAITEIGDHILLLPETAGGHMATKAILNRLGLIVEEFPVDIDNQKINVAESKALIDRFKPKVVFIDRSEGLVYEDFSWMNDIDEPIKIFDASQYLTNIIAGDYMNPFEMGFDIILSTMHKNLPGPQRAFLCAKKENNLWRQLKSGISTFVSNMHFHSIYSAGLLLGDFDKLQTLSKQMLKNTMLLENVLQECGLEPVGRSITDCTPNTHHIWLPALTRELAFQWYLNLESIGILTNYRKLPYGIGYGLRLGLSAATYRGLNETHIPILGELVADAINAPSAALHKRVITLLEEIDKRQE